MPIEHVENTFEIKMAKKDARSGTSLATFLNIQFGRVGVNAVKTICTIYVSKKLVMSIIRLRALDE